MSIRREVGDRKGEGETLSNLGFFHRTLGKYDEALKHYEEALSIRREVGDRGGEGTTLHNLGFVYELRGEKDNARKCYREALGIHKDTGNGKGQGLTLWSIGNLYFNEDNYGVALASYLLARDIFEDLQIPQKLVVMQRSIEVIRSRIGDNRFAQLLAQVKSQAHQLVEQALLKGV